jgi:hypothetical protein
VNAKSWIIYIASVMSWLASGPHCQKLSFLAVCLTHRTCHRGSRTSEASVSDPDTTSWKDMANWCGDGFVRVAVGYSVCRPGSACWPYAIQVLGDTVSLCQYGWLQPPLLDCLKLVTASCATVASTTTSGHLGRKEVAEQVVRQPNTPCWCQLHSSVTCSVHGRQAANSIRTILTTISPLSELTVLRGGILLTVSACGCSAPCRLNRLSGPFALPVAASAFGYVRSVLELAEWWRGCGNWV